MLRNGKKNKIYCAGPLFNAKERQDMADLANALVSGGYDVFLPQRDGLEFANLLPILLQHDIPEIEASTILNHAVFSLDVYQIMDSDGLVVNMDGRVPDEGAMVEAGIAWAHCKPVVIFKTDARSLVQGHCNPLLLGLSGFETVDRHKDVPIAFDQKFAEIEEDRILGNSSGFTAMRECGKTITEYLAKQKPAEELVTLLISLFQVSPCEASLTLT